MPPLRLPTGRRCAWLRGLLPPLLAAGLTAALADDSADAFPAPHDTESGSPLDPAAAAAAMRVPEGFTVDVFAAEPLVANPIAAAWDDRGRLWVAENFTYAERGVRFEASLRDRVIVLADDDRDGRADGRTVFTDRVQRLTSVELGRGGVWLMCPPRLLFVPDADSDAVPDGRPEVVLDGFDVADSNHHNFANGLRWGPDGWLYGRAGHSCPGLVGPPGTTAADRVPLRGGIWRYHPAHRRFEVVCHGTVNPWGHDWDRHGELFFVNTVIGHLWHAMPGAHFRESWGESVNPDVHERLDTIADHHHFDTSRSWTESRDGRANEFGGGHAHVGCAILQSEAWPERWRGRLFTVNMHGRRVNVERLERSGAGYAGRHEPDFLTADDPFFRGVEILEGPDGALYLLDWSDTGECHEHSGVHRSSGRIFRIAPPGTPPRPAAGAVSKPWCTAGSDRLESLWRDHRAGRTTPAGLRAALADPDGHLRTWAVRLLTDLWPLDTIRGPRPATEYPTEPETLEALVRLARDERDGLVQLTLASTLQRLPIDARRRLAAELVAHADRGADRDLPALVWYGCIPLADADPAGLLAVVEACRWPRFRGWAARSIAARIDRDEASLDHLLAIAADFPEEDRRAVLRGIQAALRGRRSAPPPPRWKEFRDTLSLADRPIAADLDLVFGDGRAAEDLRRIAQDSAADPTARRDAIASLARSRDAGLRQLCLDLLDERAVNLAAARGLAGSDDPEAMRRLLRAYPRFAAEDRPAVLEILASRPSSARVLVDGLAEAGSGVTATDLTAAHARQILDHGDADLRERLAANWGTLRTSPADREEAIRRLGAALTDARLAEADLPRGRELFHRTCGQCHRLFGSGGETGPDLTGAQRSSLDYLLVNVLDPSAAVPATYRSRVVALEDGRVVRGQLVRQDARVIELQTPTERIVLPVAEIAEIGETDASPMPEGLLDRLSADEVRDLFAYLMQTVPSP